MGYTVDWSRSDTHLFPSTCTSEPYVMAATWWPKFIVAMGGLGPPSEALATLLPPTHRLETHGIWMSADSTSDLPHSRPLRRFVAKVCWGQYLKIGLSRPLTDVNHDSNLLSHTKLFDLEGARARHDPLTV